MNTKTFVQKKIVALSVSKRKEVSAHPNANFFEERPNFVTCRAFPSQNRHKAIISVISKTITYSSLSFSETESILSLFTATFPMVPLGLLHLLTLEWQVISQVCRVGENVSTVPIRGDTVSHLCW